MTIQHTITIGDEQLAIVIRKHPKSRRIVIRYQPVQHHVSLTLPRYVSVRQGLHFIEQKRDWITRRLQEKPTSIPFADGQTLPILGKNYVVCHVGGRGVVRVEENINSFPLEGGRLGWRSLSASEMLAISPAAADPHLYPPPSRGRENYNARILVPGDKEFLPRRLREWIKRRTREEIIRLANEKAAILGKKVKRISLRDTSSRWGSCSHEGNMSFSWRLAFAPYEVLDYLVAHEVAHLAHLNHSPAFWMTVHRLCPKHEKWQQWLKTHGAVLYGYG